MPSAALLAATPPPAPSERRAKRRPSSSGTLRALSVPGDVLELADLLDRRLRIPEGSEIDPRVVAQMRRQMRLARV
jgi:hypothetical protein